MKYRLKDFKLHKKLDELTNGTNEVTFTSALNYECQRIFEKNQQRMDCPGRWIAVSFGDCRTVSLPTFQMVIRIEDIVPYEEYDPCKWNKWPNVTPPANVPMRVTKVRNGNIEAFCCRAWVPESNFNLQWRKDYGGAWWAVHGGHPDDIDEDTWEPGYTFLFRPWDDPDGEEDEE